MAISSVHIELRHVEEILAKEGIDVSYETVRCWTIKFGPQIAENLNRTEHHLLRVGTWMKWSAECGASACIYGARSMMKEKCSTS